MRPSTIEGDEARRLLLVKATAMRLKLAALPSERRAKHEAEAAAYVTALKAWERGAGAYPKPPEFLTGKIRPQRAPAPQPAAAGPVAALHPRVALRPPIKTDHPASKQTLGERVRATRKALGWSQKALADRARVSADTIGRIENARGIAVGAQHALGKIKAAFGAEGEAFDLPN